VKIAHETVSVSGVDLEMFVLGEGKPLLYLHGGKGPHLPHDTHLKELAKSYRVYAPWHPGFGMSDRPNDIREIGDLAYLYLDLAAQLGLRGGVLAGASFGGWIALEMLVRDPASFSGLVLASPLGLKLRGREDRDIEDVFGMTDDEFLQCAYADPKRGALDVATLDDDALAAHFRGQVALAAYTWRPYMHNPQLKRWLHRVALPTLVVAGDSDGLVFDGYHAGFCELLPNAKLHVIEDAGHFPQSEHPKEFAQLVTGAFGPASENARGVAKMMQS
jgi:pimeloyl-ACP methyl ester carboxylesterase